MTDVPDHNSENNTGKVLKIIILIIICIRCVIMAQSIAADIYKCSKNNFSLFTTVYQLT